MTILSSVTSTWSLIKHYLNLLRISLLYQFKEFFNNSTLHGVKYIAEADRPFAERFMWFLFTATGLISALVIIASLWEKFQTNPTITGLDTNFQSTQMIFPTVLICPSDAYDDQAVAEVAFKLISGKDSALMEDYEEFLRQLTGLSLVNLQEFYKTASNLTEVPLDDLNLRDLLSQVAVKCEDVFNFCTFKGMDLDCCESFQPMTTERGFCYGFNLKYVYSEKDPKKPLERNTGMFDLLDTDKKWSLVMYPKLTSKIYIHSQSEISGLEMTSPEVSWNTDYSVDILVTMKETITTADTKQLSVGQRKCLFPEELQLKYFSQDEYTFSSCMVECRMQLSLKLCNCVLPFYSTLTSKEFPYCTLGHFPCLLNHQRNLTNLKECAQCELSCHSIVYEIDKLSKSDATAGEGADDAGPYVNIEYSWPIIRYKREVLFGWVDLLVSFGGIAGLFLGFSLLSGVEIIYFFTLRAWCMVYNEREVLEEIDRKSREKPLEEFYLGLKLKGKDARKDVGCKGSNSKMEKTSKLLIFDGRTEKKIPDFVPNRNKPVKYASRLNLGKVHPDPYTHKKTTIFIRARPEDVPIFPYLP